jgi:hypothetical protein
MQVYFIFGGIAIILGVMLFLTLWAYRLGKKRGREEIRNEVRQAIKKRNKDLLLRILNPSDADFGSVQHDDAEWTMPPKTSF